MNVKELNTLIIKKVILLSCLTFLWGANLFAQCPDVSLTCNPIENIFLGQPECEDIVEPDDILEGSFTPGCYTVSLFLEDGTPLSPPNVINENHIGLTLSVIVTNIETGTESCTNSVINVFDSTDPIITDCDDITVDCGDSIDPMDIGQPTVTDCDLETFEFEDAAQVNGTCADPFLYTIDRTWTATDGSGNTSTCTQTITVNRLMFDPTTGFPSNTTISCTESSDPANTGYPTVGGMDITSASSPTCGFTASFNDTPINGSCTGESVILREWMVMDGCGNMWMMDPKQVITIEDDNDPTFNNIPSDITISTGSVNCLGLGVLPTVTASDACSSATVMTTVPGGTVTGNIVSNLSVGSHTATVTATDACGRTSTLTYNITVEDQTPPTPICESFHTVSLTNASPTLVPAFVFDDGSFDACGAVTFEVRRMEGTQCTFTDATSYGDFVPFFCCDIGETIMVELRVTDESMNTNSCMVEVIVQDKIDPILTCPIDKVLDCHQDFEDLGLTGSATAIDNCASITPTYTDNGTLNSCGVGTIFRTWTAADGQGNIVSCIQTITVENQTAFNINSANDNDPTDDVIWPADISNSGCTLPATTGEPTLLNEDICSQVGFFSDDVFLPVQNGPGCQRILRTWTVFDNCQPASAGEQCDPLLNAADIAHWCYTQDITVINTTDPVFTDCPTSLSFDSDDPNCATGVATLTARATDDCNSLNYNYQIDLDYLNNPGIDIPWTADPDNDGSHIATYPLGTHLVTWKVEDFCGNFEMCSYPFTIRDGKAPTPNLLSSIARNLMAGLCMVEVAPTEFDNPSSPSFDNCGIDSWLIQSPSIGAPFPATPPAAAQPTWVFSGAASVGNQSVDIWILDINGNWSVTTVNINIQDNNVPACSTPPDYAIVAGGIENEEGEDVEYVMVEISGDMEEEEETGNNGTYSFDLPMENNYTVTPERDDNPLNGVSTYDLVKISQHILDVETLPTPYKIIAADINNSGSVTTLDLVELRKLILFIDTEFSNNTSWRFVDASFVFPNPADPFETSFPEVYTINDLNEDMLADFVGIKVGDVNCSAAPNDFTGSSDDRSNGETLNFFIEDQHLTTGQTYTVDFKVKDLKDFLGYQFTLAFDQSALAFENIVPGVFEGIDENNFGLSFIDQGIITSSWHTTSVLSTEDVISFSLTFTAMKDAKLSELININSRYTQAQAYFNNEFSDVSLAFESENGIATNHFQLFQNRPNPFKGETVISFNLPESNLGTLTIFDVSGRAVKVVQGDFNKGYNEVDISSTEMKGHGVFYYQLEVADHIATRKMVLLK